MSQNREIIYLAALLHDIGKFYERAFPEKYKKDDVYKWSHAVYTRKFFDDYKEVRDVLSGHHMEKEKGDLNLINLAAKHHNAKYDEEKIIQYADWLSSSERLPKVDEDYQEGKSRQPLLSVFSNIYSDENNIDKNFLPLGELSLDNIPEIKSDPKDVDEKVYESLWEKFLKEFTQLKNLSSTKNLAETFLNLLRKYTTTIPSSTRKNEIPDVSLFDHSKTTAAFATAIYNYLQETGKPVDTINMIEENPFILIGADLSGIQKFIYDIIGKNASKNLKGRSFFIHILMESIVQLILKDLGLFKANVIYSAGGNFYIIAQNTENTKKELDKLIVKINRALARAYRYKLYLALDYTEFGKKDLIDEGELGDIWSELISNKLNKKKHQRYLNELNDQFFQPLDLAKETLMLDKDKITGEMIFKGEKTKVLPDVGTVRFATYKQIRLGQLLRDAKYWVISFEKNTGIKDENVFNPFDSRFMAGEDAEIEVYNTFINSDEELKYFTNAEIIRLNKLDFFNIHFKNNIQSFDFYGGNDFPVYSETDLERPEIKKKIESGDIGEENIKPKVIKQFDDLALGANLDRLGILRMDVDNLGKIFAQGFNKEMRTFSRFTTLSRNLDWFFRGYLNTLWQKHFNENTMIIYSGGDDLFIVGRWDKTIQFADEIRSEFKKFTCNNPGLSISGGVSVITGKFPVLKGAMMAGSAEEAAKEHTLKKIDNTVLRKNSFTLFNKALNWEWEYPVVKEIKDEILQKLSGETPKSFARILLQSYAMREKQLNHNKKFREGKEPNKLNESWYWMVLYLLKRFAERNEKDKNDGYTNQVIKDIAANTYLDKTKFFLNPENHILYYYGLAARWAELELRTNKKENER